MIKILEFALLAVSLVVILGLVFAGPKSAPPPAGRETLGAADPPPSSNGEANGHKLAS
jgi:hypothetical protein